MSSIDQLITAANGLAISTTAVSRKLSVPQAEAEDMLRGYFNTHSDAFQLHYVVTGTTSDTNTKVFRKAKTESALADLMQNVVNPQTSVYALVPMHAESKACAIQRDSDSTKIRAEAGAPAQRMYPTLTRQKTIDSITSANRVRTLGELFEEDDEVKFVAPPAPAPGMKTAAPAPKAVKSANAPLVIPPPAEKPKTPVVSPPVPVPVAAPKPVAPKVEAVAKPASPVAQKKPEPIVVDENSTASVVEVTAPPAPAPATETPAAAPAAVAPKREKEPETPATAPPRKQSKKPAAKSSGGKQLNIMDMFGGAAKRKRDAPEGPEPNGAEVALEKKTSSDSAVAEEVTPSRPVAGTTDNTPAAGGVTPAAAAPAPAPKKTRGRPKKSAEKKPAPKGSIKALAKKTGEKRRADGSLVDDEDSDSADDDDDADKIERQRYDEQFESGELQVAANDDIVVGGSVWQPEEKKAITAPKVVETTKRARDAPLPSAQARITTFFNPEVMKFQKDWIRTMETVTTKVNGEYVCNDEIMYRHKTSGELISEESYRHKVQRVKDASEAAAAAAAAAGADAAEEVDAVPAKKEKKEKPAPKQQAPAQPVKVQSKLTAFFTKKQ